jgi:hypothetical protein
VIFPVIFCGCEYWSYIQRRRYADNVWELSAEENIFP